jgi:hypothetical protein
MSLGSIRSPRQVISGRQIKEEQIAAAKRRPQFVEKK